MGRRFRLVRGGTNESLTCACMAVVDKTKHTETTCGCTESKYFVGNVPEKWICDKCAAGRHVAWGGRQ